MISDIQLALSLRILSSFQRTAFLFASEKTPMRSPYGLILSLAKSVSFLVI